LKLKPSSIAKKKCKTQQWENNVTLLKTFMKLSMILVQGKYKENIASCPITKASNHTHFHSYFFSFCIFPANISDLFFFFCYLCDILEIEKNVANVDS